MIFFSGKCQPQEGITALLIVTVDSNISFWSESHLKKLPSRGTLSILEHLAQGRKEKAFPNPRLHLSSLTRSRLMGL